MRFVAVLFVLAAVSICDVYSECCYGHLKGLKIYCGDCNIGTPYCSATGSCNVFGCNCDGGCRQGNFKCSGEKEGAQEEGAEEEEASLDY